MASRTTHDPPTMEQCAEICRRCAETCRELAGATP